MQITVNCTYINHSKHSKVVSVTHLKQREKHKFSHSFHYASIHYTVRKNCRKTSILRINKRKNANF